MITASAVASELRRIADVFDKSPETKLIQPRLSFYFGYADTKEQFLDLAKVFPRPFDKGDGYDHQQYTLKHETDAWKSTRPSSAPRSALWSRKRGQPGTNVYRFCRSKKKRLSANSNDRC